MHQPDFGARICHYRCFLPDLAGLAGLRRVGPGTGTSLPPSGTLLYNRAIAIQCCTGDLFHALQSRYFRPYLHRQHSPNCSDDDLVQSDRRDRHHRRQPIPGRAGHSHLPHPIRRHPHPPSRSTKSSPATPKDAFTMRANKPLSAVSLPNNPISSMSSSILSQKPP